MDAPSFASLLVRQSPSPHYGNGWIMGKDGKPWHPSRSQDDLLKGLCSKPATRKKKLLSFIAEFLSKRK